MQITFNLINKQKNGSLFLHGLKGAVHTKMTIFVIIYSPLSFLNLHELLTSAKQNVGNQPFLIPTDFHSIFPPYHGSQWKPALPTFFKISSMFKRLKNIIQVWTNLRMNNYDRTFIFFLFFNFLFIVYANLTIFNIHSI